MLLILLACNDQKLGTFNGDPSAAILSPDDGALLGEGDAVELRGSASDPDDGASTLVATWFADGAEACSGAPAEDGTTTCSLTVPAGLSALRLEVRDPQGAAASDEITVQVPTTWGPDVTIEAPADGSTAYEGEGVTLAGVAVDAEDPPEALTWEWVSSVDGPLSLAGGLDAAGRIEGIAFLTAGNHVLTFAATDTDGKIGSDSVALTVRPPNEGPACGILDPADGARVRLGDEVSFAGTATDPDGDATDLVVTWTSDRDGPFGSAPPTSAGEVTARAALSAGAHVVTLAVEDPAGARCTDAVSLAVTSPPEVVIDSPTDGDVAPQGLAVTLSGTVGDAEDAPEDLLITWASDRDGVLWTDSADASGGTLYVTEGLSAGTHLLSLTATDTDGLSATATVRLLVDAPPSAPSITLTPDPATSADDLTASVTTASIDPEGAAVSYRYAWFVDGVASGASVSAVLPASATTRGETWTVRVTPEDGVQDGPFAEAAVRIDNALPSVASVSISPDPATGSDVLTCAWTGFADADGDADASTVAWTVDGRSAGSGATLSTGFTRGDLVTCTVTPFDGAQAGAPVADSLTIGNATPEVGSVGVTPSTPTTNDTLTASAAGTDADGDALSFTYDWWVDGVFVLGGSSTLSGLTAFDKGDRVVVVATASDGRTTSAPVSSATIVVANSPPGAPGVAIAPVDPLGGVDDLVCSVATAATDADGDPLTYRMSWTVDGVPWTGATSTAVWPGDTIDAADTAGGDTWTCSVTPADDEEDGAVGTATVLVGDAAIDYSDLWTLDRTISYRCAYGFVNFSITRFTITDANPVITIATGSGNPGTLSGSFTGPTDVEAQNVLPGSCTETYEVLGTFVDENTLNGTFTATFTPSRSGACYDCTDGSWSFTATR